VDRRIRQTATASPAEPGGLPLTLGKGCNARQGREDQLGALGLIVNAVVLWNTIYTDAALNQLRMEGFKILDEDVARLSPLGHDHINMLGRYAFTLPARVALGELRPLRDPNLLVDEAV
jgi:hypothetical protein